MLLKILPIFCAFQFIYTKEYPSVIIIGAGPSGLAAAVKLLENNITNITVLEAEDRIGGRVKSVPFGEAVVDLGAEWCHGVKDNAVHALVKDFDVLGHQSGDYKMFVSDQHPVEDQFGVELHELFDNAFGGDDDIVVDDGLSIGEHFIKTYNSSIHEKYKNEPEKLHIAFASLELFDHYVLSSEGAFSWFDASANTDYKFCDGDLMLHWKGRGFKTALDILTKQYPKQEPNFPIESKIKLNQQATRIIWDNNTNTGGSVITQDGGIYHADHIIFTPSLGVLKNTHGSLFEPALPQGKVDAIHKLGFGAVMKVMVHFPERWWPTNNFSGCSFVWLPHHKEMLVVDFPEGPKRQGRSWLLDLFGLYPVQNNPNVLSAWFTGEFVPEIEQLSNETITNGIMFALNQFLGHKYNIPKPDQIISTNWNSNPNFRGTYSFQTIASRKLVPTANVRLGEPLYNKEGTPTLLFAGETTHPHYYSTVHGAIETGRREANRIINL